MARLWVIIATILIGILLAAGFTASVFDSTNTAGTAPYFTCTSAVAANSANALFVYGLNEASGSKRATDSVAGHGGNPNNGVYVGTMTSSATSPLACLRDTGGAYVLDGTSAYVRDQTKAPATNTLPEEVWFKTSTAAGKLIGLGSSAGVAPGGVMKTIASTSTYTDGLWHLAAATLSSSGAMLYLDGSLVASDSTTSSSLGHSLSGAGR